MWVQGGCLLVGGNQIDEPAADQLLACLSGVSAVGVVDERQRRVWQVAADQIALLFHHAAVALFALAQGRHGQTSIHGRPKHLDHVFEQGSGRGRVVPGRSGVPPRDFNRPDPAIGHPELSQATVREVGVARGGDIEGAEPGANRHSAGMGPGPRDGMDDLFQPVGGGHHVLASQDARHFVKERQFSYALAQVVDQVGVVRGHAAVRLRPLVNRRDIVAQGGGAPKPMPVTWRGQPTSGSGRRG